jgi:hypothetical protein
VAHCLDISALVKPVVSEAETVALRGWLTVAEREPVPCDLAKHDETDVVVAVREANRPVLGGDGDVADADGAGERLMRTRGSQHGQARTRIAPHPPCWR